MFHRFLSNSILFPGNRISASGLLHSRNLSQTLHDIAVSKVQNQPEYCVRRTPSNQLPIYHIEKNGGNKKLTRIRKVEGNVKALRDELREAMNLTEKECTINHLTGHVLVKGHRKQEIINFLTERKF
ncbi:putative mitochondrial large ribosomal subunit [Golovinomyces cichoracearum]|uniref:Large ribosomal subunit protein mL49 n=1 Tax=Golovinomyces cichoracearum TaxID=62708 RepID=A0A420H9E6_9PEZI|nr:putative mitochondrial large ribosomal subunit [Golovinomyces cichoracearum]